MERGNNQPGQSFEWFQSGDDIDEQLPQGVSGHRMQPKAVALTTVQVSDLDDGALFLQVWPDGLSAYLSPVDAVPLKRELARAFRHVAQIVPSDHGAAW